MPLYDNIDTLDMYKNENIIVHPVQGVHSEVDKKKHEIEFNIDDTLNVNQLELTLNIAGKYNTYFKGQVKTIKADKFNKKKVTMKVIVRKNYDGIEIFETNGKMHRRVKYISPDDNNKVVAKLGAYHIKLTNVTSSYWLIIKTFEYDTLYPETELSTRCINLHTLKNDEIYKTVKSMFIGRCTINGVTKRIEKQLDFWKTIEYDDGYDRPIPYEKP